MIIAVKGCGDQFDNCCEGVVVSLIIAVKGCGDQFNNCFKVVGGGCGGGLAVSIQDWRSRGPGFEVPGSNPR